MAITYSAESDPYLNNTPIQMADGGLTGSRMRRYRGTIEYDGQAAADEIMLFTVPAGSRFVYGVITATATAGASATIAIGIASTESDADPDYYRTAATFTTADVPTNFGRSLAVHEDAQTADRTVSALVAVAALPTHATNKLTVDMFFSAP